MPRRQLATSSGFRWTPASPPASVARMTGRRCWHRRSIASSSLVRNGACAASNPEPTCRPASGSGPPCAQASARSPGWRLRASIVVRVKVLITGGSGYIGRHLSTSLAADGHEVVGLSRRPESAPPQSGVRFVKWDARTAEGAWVSELAGAQGIVNLAGASIGKGRWTRRRMAEILSSRLAATSAIVEAIKRTPADRRPSVLVNASGIDYYGDRGDEVITEDGAPGDSFLARLSQQWEAAAQKAEPLAVRVVRIRTAMVFGREALAFRLLTLPFRLFAGGPLGNGRQWFTWIHVDDIVSLYRLALENSQVSGPINAVAPDVRREGEVAKEIGRVLHRPAFVPAPAFILRLALGAQSQLLLHGRRATPAKVQGLGYRFKFGRLREALEDVIARR